MAIFVAQLKNHPSKGLTMAVTTQFIDIKTHGIKPINLPQSEQIELIGKAQGGCAKSASLVIRANVNVIYAVARNFASGRVSLEDIFANALEGAVKAINDFDVNGGASPTTYIKQRATAYALQEVRDNGSLIRVSAAVYFHAVKAKKTLDLNPLASTYMDGETSKPITPELRSAVSAMVRGMALDSPMGDDGKTFADVIAMDDAEYSEGASTYALDVLRGQVRPDKVIELSERINVLKTAVNALPERPREIMERIVFRNQSFREIGSQMGLSAQTVGTIYHKALDIVRRDYAMEELCEVA